MRYGNMVFNSFGPRNDLLERAMENAQLRCETGSCRNATARALSPDGLGMQFRAVDSGELTEAEAGMLVRSFLSAGIDTTVSRTRQCALLLCADFLEQWTALRENPSLMRLAFEEVLRFEAPVQTFFRTTTRDVEVAGIRLGAGEKVLLFLAAANRDPRRWERPDQFDVPPPRDRAHDVRHRDLRLCRARRSGAGKRGHCSARS